MRVVFVCACVRGERKGRCVEREWCEDGAGVMLSANEGDWRDPQVRSRSKAPSSTCYWLMACHVLASKRLSLLPWYHSLHIGVRSGFVLLWGIGGNYLPRLRLSLIHI